MAVKLTPELIKEKLEYIRDPRVSACRQDNMDRYYMYHGSIREIVEKTIRKEFKKETVQELIARLIPLNVPAKIINKLAMVYSEYPIRMPEDKNELDQELINIFEEGMDLNTRQKEHNRNFKLFKKNLQEIFVDNKGRPGVRNLPAHTYEAFSHDELTPEVPDLIIKFLKMNPRDRKNEKFAVWTDDEHWMVDGEGRVLQDEMNAMNNPTGINPIGKMPFVYTNESSLSINPIPDDDLLRMGVVIPLLLSDLAFATKYLSWSIIYTIGVAGNLSFSPNSVVSLDYGPSGEKPIIDTIKPNVSIQDTLRFVEFLVATLLTTKNLSTSTISGQLTTSSLSSGVALALDSAESMEDQKDQQGYFYKAERQLWDLIANYMIPYWRLNNLLAPKYNREFSNAFELTIIFREPRTILSEKDQIEISKMRIDNGFSTLTRELQVMYPDYDFDEIVDLILEIKKEKMESMQSVVSSFTNQIDVSTKEDSISSDLNNGE